MPAAAAKTILDDFLEHHAKARHSRPIPLKETSYDIEIESGLVVARARRVFRNDESAPIEAVLTFPAPFDGVVSRIEAKIGDRVVVGKAAAKAEARATYEKAADDGKAAVLHEELLRGIHMISVANVAAGVTIEVTATLVLPLSFSDGVGRARIPLTVGQIYGQSPLQESDDLVTGGPSGKAKVSLKAKTGQAFIGGDAIDGDAGVVSLGRPIEISVVGGEMPALKGRAADGRVVTLDFTPVPVATLDLDIDLLLDVSGSMAERVSSIREIEIRTKWKAVLDGVCAASGSSLTSADTARVWVFSNDCRKAGEARGDALDELVRSAPFMGHGTELAAAIAKVVASRKEANILLVTDGKSHTRIDIEKAIANGARVTVVLVGEDALEANVGYLAAQTGGQMFIASGGQADLAVAEAIRSMRGVSGTIGQVPPTPESVSRLIAGVEIAAKWSKAGKGAPAREGIAAAVAALAAHVAIAGMSKDAAAAFAAAEGIVSNLTSIVLVDDAGEAVDGLMATRKVSLPEADVGLYASAAPQSWDLQQASLAAPGGMARSSFRSMGILRSAGPVFGSAFSGDAPDVPDALAERDASIERAKKAGRSRFKAVTPPPGYGKPNDAPAGGGVPDSVFQHTDARVRAKESGDLREMQGRIDWDSDPQALIAGNFIQLLDDRQLMAFLTLLAGHAKILELSRAAGLRTPQLAVIALIAKLDGETSRTAARLHRAVLGKVDPALVAECLQLAGYVEPEDLGAPVI